MLDRSTFTRLYQQHARVVLGRCRSFGFRGAELEEMAQEVWAAIWEKRESWPSPESEVAYIAAFAANTAAGAQRKVLALKRRPLEQRDTGEDSGAKVDAALRVGADQVDALTHQELADAIHAAVALLPPEHRCVMAARLDEASGSLLSQFGKGRSQEALRALRRLLGIPAVAPERAGVEDPAEHLAVVMRQRARSPAALADQARVPAPLERNEENTCASASSTALNAPAAPTSRPRTSAVPEPLASRQQPVRAQQRSGGTRTVVTPASTGSATAPRSRSQRPSSACERSLRPAPSAPASGAHMRPTLSSPEPRSGAHSPSLAELASAPTLPSPRNRAPLIEVPERRRGLADEEPSFSGGAR